MDIISCQNGYIMMKQLIRDLILPAKKSEVTTKTDTEY